MPTFNRKPLVEVHFLRTTRWTLPRSLLQPKRFTRVVGAAIVISSFCSRVESAVHQPNRTPQRTHVLLDGSVRFDQQHARRDVTAQPRQFSARMAAQRHSGIVWKEKLRRARAARRDSTWTSHAEHALQSPSYVTDTSPHLPSY